ncbi:MULTISPECIES: hypothetical protein [Halomicrobium]|uniref:Uncharacterized protein n=2 Tax=Halomicrobium mukohataei TaxID=57705 RepID=C7P3L1_HALMD|nr:MULTISPECIES: hypothetical protein [Halomicrobium]ACV47683.1 hypothetical protein Hmuk_1569 [Halomicrobium mukohataei DSM 12286]QCD66138.1 hypothetical protein E5139_10970 [Halomicrobium mukohataei]QFR20943.1 hypothetical protein GBQ70_10965 [Halomicrobium sp. ZPS1]
MLEHVLWEFLLPVGLIAAVFVAVEYLRDWRIARYLFEDRGRAVVYGTAGALVAVGIGTTYVLGDPAAAPHYVGLDTYHLAWTVFLVGVAATAYGGRHYRLATAIHAADAVTPATVPASGHVLVDGVAKPCRDGQAVSASDGSPALVVQRGECPGFGAVEDQVESARGQALVATERRMVPFDLTGPDGAIRVDPTDASPGFLTGQVEGDEIERVLAPGDAVTVFGRAAESDSLEAAVLAERGPEALDQFARNSRRLIHVGLPLAVVGYVGMGLAAGIP